ncbi:hypothetical protein ACFQ1E_00855 [Sphingomonas canadensis]|uniref:Energy transducer TonB n=1 Tax=Sphingomonas canadensis TaxID=1219257 RepID=A0ABW3H150_9SPHN|nr:hypothetical protein [Sphingomonas canadensis]MCW3835210.1 hypothetical protein [Sphingomonas canadensis]
MPNDRFQQPGYPVPVAHAQRRLFGISALVALAVALLCALLPAGLPSSTRIGSAFSPATVQETTSAPSKRLAAKRGIEEDEGRAAKRARPSAAPELIAAAVPALRAPSAPGAAAPVPLPFKGLATAALRGLPLPREPPAA